MSEYVKPIVIAKEMYNSFYSLNSHQSSVKIRELTAKASSIVHIDGLITLLEHLFYDYGLGYIGKCEARNDITEYKKWQHLQKVKEEIKKL